MIDLILIESDGKREKEKARKKNIYISLVEEKMISKKNDDITNENELKIHYYYY